MATIGKNANEIEKAAVPRGLVHQRRALFAGESVSCAPNYTTPLELPSTSLPISRRESVEERELIHHEERRHLSIEVTRLHAPADLVRRSPDDDVSHLQRRVVLVRNPVSQEPTITVNEVRGHTSNQRTLSVNRVFPIVSIRVGEQAVSSSRHAGTTDWHARPPQPSTSIFRAPGSGPVHKNFSSTPTKLNEIRPIEHIDTVSYDKRAASPPKDYYIPVASAPPVHIIRKMPSRSPLMDVHSLEKRAAHEIDDIYRRGDDVDSEIARKEEELEKAKLVINQLSHDLEKLEKDRKVMEDSVIEEEDLSLSGLGDSEPDNEREKKVVMDAEEILRECNRMMLQLQEEEEADQELLEKIQRGESSEEEIQLEIIRLQKQVAELNAMGVELPALLSAKQGSRRSKEDTSQIVSLKDQAVMFSTGGAAARQEALISRLERELTDAQTCNHRLNAQLGTLANNNESTLKKEYTELNVSLLHNMSETEKSFGKN